MSYKAGGCGATQLNAYLIGPEGELYKCWNELGRQDKIIENIKESLEKNLNLLLNYLSGPSIVEDVNCLKCCLYFVCDGGCQYMRIDKKLNNNNLCNYVKANMEKYLDEYYNQKQEYNNKK